MEIGAETRIRNYELWEILDLRWTIEDLRIRNQKP